MGKSSSSYTPPPPPAARPQRKIGVEEDDIILGGKIEDETSRKGKASLIRPKSGTRTNSSGIVV